MPGGAKVGDDEAGGGEEEVRGLYIAVDDVFAVEVGEASKEVVKEWEEFWGGGEGEGRGEG